MRVFQADECMNSKRFEAACNSEGRGGLYRLYRFPKSFKGRSIKDPEILRHFFDRGTPIITNDEEMLSEHANAIPEEHPGLIVVAFSPDCQEIISDRVSMEMLARFKSLFPAWATIPCSNSVVVITERWVEIMHKEGGGLLRDAQLEYRSQAVESLLIEVLNANAGRSTRRFPDS